MFKTARRAMAVGILGSTVVVPYMAATGKKIDSLWTWAQSPRGANSSAAYSTDPNYIPPVGGEPIPALAALPGAPPAKAEIAPPHELAEVFRFDITIDWIMTHWPVVSTLPPAGSLQGFRVPLLTGIGENDVAGSLTYYYGPDRRLRKIVFEGVSGNVDRLINEVAAPNGLARTQSVDPGLFLYQRSSSGQVESELRVRPAEVVRAANPNRRFSISLLLTPQTASWYE
ncbi:MAG: hypothetical protein K8T25_24500 [Planctomycetia bacterium]|nr:hypothetical protein [Planctomycetia bacterium]